MQDRLASVICGLQDGDLAFDDQVVAPARPRLWFRDSLTGPECSPTDIGEQGRDGRGRGRREGHAQMTLEIPSDKTAIEPSASRPQRTTEVRAPFSTGYTESHGTLLPGWMFRGLFVGRHGLAPMSCSPVVTDAQVAARARDTGLFG